MVSCYKHKKPGVAAAFPSQQITRMSSKDRDNSLQGVEEMESEPGHQIPPCEEVTELKQSFAAILKYLSRMETSLRKTEEQADHTEDTGTGVTIALREEFRGRVGFWDEDGMISMIRSTPQLMLETFTWAKSPEDGDFVFGSVSSIFQLAIITNRVDFVAEMLKVAPPETLNPSKMTLRKGTLNGDFVISPLELASVMHERMAGLLVDATKVGLGVFLRYRRGHLPPCTGCR